MGRHRKPSHSHPTRRVGLGLATGALGLTGFALSSTSAQAAEVDKPTREQLSERYGYEISLEDFAKLQQQKNPNRLDKMPPDEDGLVWGTDGCSWSPDIPQKSCDRHDFNYRNAQQQRRWTAESHKKADDQFCNKDLPTEVGRATAGVYCGGVKAYGTLHHSVGLPAYDKPS